MLRVSCCARWIAGFRRGWMCCMLGWLVCATLAARGGEPAEQFLQALRERGYYETALEYLTQMETSPLAPIDFRRVIAYERAITLVSAAGAELDPTAREKLLDQAELSLNEFLTNATAHPLAQAARNQLGNLLYMRGVIKVQLSKRNNDPALLNQARQFYDQAHGVFVESQKTLRERLSPINNRQYDVSQKAEIEARDQMRSDYLQAQLLAAQVLEDRAHTATAGTPEHLQMLQEADKQYLDIEEKYRTLIAAPLASLGRGRCHQGMGKLKEALGFYTELMGQPVSEDLRPIKTEALQRAMECWLDPSIKLYAEAVNRGTAWQQSLRPHELRDPLALTILYQLAVANKHYSELIKESNPRDRQVNDLLRTARGLAFEVSKHPSDAQEAARQLLADLRGVELDPQQRPDPKTFAEAQAAGNDALDQMQNAVFLVQALPERLANESDPEIKADLEKQLAEAQQHLVGKRQDAVGYYRQSLGLINADVALDDVNLVRTRLSHLLYLEENYLDAALLAEFVVRRYPAHAAAREAAKIALAGYVQLYTQAAADDRDFEIRHLKDLSNYIVGQWPDQPVAADAWNALIPFIVQDGDFERARQGLNRIPDTLPQRGEIELKLGRALWGAYRQGLAELRKWEREGAPAGADIGQKKTQLDAWKSQAEGILSAGVQRVRNASGRVDASFVLATLSLAQTYIETQQTGKAVALLEDAQIGPLTLVRADHGATAASGTPEEIYRTCLRAYLGAMAAGDNAAESMNKAKAMMAELKARVAGDPTAEQRLIGVYIGLVRDLKSQMDIASDEERRSLSSGFEAFLSQVAKETNEFQILNWAAETFFNLAESLDDPAALAATPAAASLFQQALTIYERILAEAAKSPEYLPAPQYDLLLRMRVASISRRTGKYEAAMDTLVNILKQKNMLLNVQVEAARTYQMWAAFPGKHELYQRAMLGFYPDANAKPPANIVWGWGKIGQLTAGRKDFEPVFLEARYNLARCRYEYARRSQDEEAKTRYLDLAKKDVWFTYNYSKELGGAEWRPKYDQLLKDIQKSRQEPATGLAEFEKK
jgi:hypothetical protein